MPNRCQAITWTNAGPVHWRIYVSLGGDELTCQWNRNWWFANVLQLVLINDFIWGPFYYHGLTLIPAWVSNYMPSKVLRHWSLGMDKGFHPTLYDGCNYLSMLGLNLIHVSKWGHGSTKMIQITGIQRNLEESISDFIISTADGLVPFGASSSAGTIMTMRGFRILMGLTLNTLRLRQNGHHFADNIFKCISMNEKFCILIRISLKFVPKGSIDIKSVLVQVMAWHWTGNKPLSELMVP